jgi:hypothetical protein
MFHFSRAATTGVAAVFIASLIGVGVVAAQSVRPALTFKNSGKVKISVKVDKIGYREDIETGKSVAVPAAKLQSVDPKDTGIVWEAYQADLKSVQQTKPNPKCDGGTIKFNDKGAATIDVKGSC